MTDLRRRLKDEFVPAGWSPDESLVDVRLAARHGRRRRATRAACGAAGVGARGGRRGDRCHRGARVYRNHAETCRAASLRGECLADSSRRRAAVHRHVHRSRRRSNAGAHDAASPGLPHRADPDSGESRWSRLGHSVQIIYLRNVSTVPCRLIGTVRVSRLPADGGGVLASEPVTQLANGPVTLGAGMQGDLIEETTNCPKPPGRLLHAVTLQIGEGFWTVAGMSVSLSCGPLILVELVPPRQPPPTPTGIASLIATGVIPATARPGQRLVYTVTLSNHTSSTVRIPRCPTFTEGLVTDLQHTARRYQWTYRLNCGSVHSLAPRTSASFQMILDVPADAEWNSEDVLSLDAWPMQVVVGKIIRVQG